MRLSKKNTGGIIRSFLLLISFFVVIGGLYAQTEFPSGNFWSLDAGIGMSDIQVQGQSFQLVIDPKLWLSPQLMVGSKAGINYSTDNIFTLEGQVYLRWNFLRLGNPENTINVFLQGGLGLLAAYRGENNPFDNVTMTRGSVLADAAVGVTIPLTSRWHIEPLVRGGYPHIFGFSVTAGYKFPLPRGASRVEYRTESRVESRIEYREIIRTLPFNEIVRHINIFAIEFVLFGPDVGSYNVGIDRDAQQLNELVLNYTAQVLKDNPTYRVRLEGHANPYTIHRSEADDLMALSALRANEVAAQLRERGVSDEQMVIIAFGGTRNATSEWDVRNRNRRVELMIIQLDPDTN
ncbi:MAG: OmpA family protein [Treponema sp.]|nr:OmpA family protein [Treponema sp.]